MSDQLVVVITNRYDSHADFLIQMFWERGIPFARFNSDDFPARTTVSVAMARRSYRADLQIYDRTFREEDIRSIWFRRPLRYHIDEAVRDPESRKFAEDEAAAFADSLWSCLKCKWVSRPTRIRAAQHKLMQLRLADELGFNIPRTLATNDPEAFRQFWTECGGQVIYKALGRNQTRDSEGRLQFAYTNKLNANFLNQVADVRLAPCLFQEYVEKRVELRITVVGKRVFTCEIQSQETERTRIDWRRYDIDNTPHRVVQISEDLEKKCLELVAKLGLEFAAIDMIVTPAGEYVFLEINPNGQWLWIEQLTGLQISEALFDLLTNAESPS